MQPVSLAAITYPGGVYRRAAVLMSDFVEHCRTKMFDKYQ